MAEGGRGMSHRIYKKSSPNNKMTLYVACRDLVLEANRTQRVEGVLLVDPEYADIRKVFGQIVLTSRYGIKDEDQTNYFNEVSVKIAKIWPADDDHRMDVTVSSLQALVRRLGPNATPFCIEVASLGPPSLVLMMREPYEGPLVGISYDLRVFLAEAEDDMVSKRNVVRMGIRVSQSAADIATAPLLTPSSLIDSFRVKPRYQRFKFQRRPRKLDEDTITDDDSVITENELIEENRDNEELEMRPDWSRNEARNTLEDIQECEEISEEIEPVSAAAPRPAPRLIVEKSFLLSARKIYLESWLDKSSYHHGEQITVSFRITNNSTKTVRSIKAKVVQYVFYQCANDTFKNVVAASDDAISVLPGQAIESAFTMVPRRVPPTEFIALQEPEGSLAATTITSSTDHKIIMVSYYIKLTLSLNKFGGEMAVKIPLSLSHSSQP